MEPIKFLMTDTGAGCTAACKERFRRGAPITQLIAA